MSDAALILIVDDERSIREALARALTQAGLSSIAAGSIAEARSQVANASAVLLDIRLKDGSGLELLAELRRTSPHLPVIMATAYGDSERTIEAMKLGAFDYHTKPFDLDRLVATLRRATARTNVVEHARGMDSSSLVGASARMLEVWKAIGRAATSDVPVLITGETGTGKELVARAIHDHGARRREPLVAVNLAALSPSLLESELFGHEKGAFTNANERRLGRFEMAGDGTLFLDEIGDLDAALQTKLLRVLQEGSFERVGGGASIVTKARIVSATSKPVLPHTPGSALREDLFYRLGVLRIELPPLRDRRSDIPLLVDAFLRPSPQAPARALTDGAMDRLMRHDWPGNVRELQHVLARAVVMSPTEIIDEEALALAPSSLSPLVETDDLDLRRNQLASERALITRALARAKGNRAEAARLLGIARQHLYSRMKELGLS